MTSHASPLPCLCQEFANTMKHTTLSGYWAFVDGSHRGDEVTYGVAMLKDGVEIAALQGQVAAEEDLFGPDLPAILASGSRQIPGEITAVYKAIAWCHAQGVQHVTIAHDLKGLPEWATGRWRANTPATRRLQQDAPHWPVRVTWVKVKGHSGHAFNDRADALARSALSAQPPADDIRPEDLQRLEVQKGHAFCLHLQQSRISAECLGLINHQFARVVIGTGEGFVDIYQSPKRSWDRPYMHGFKQRQTRQRIVQAWAAFVTAG